MKNANGKVCLIGAGPGDVELLTLKAVRVLGLADVVLLDDLVSRDILQFTKPNVRVVEVGKRGGCKSTPQAFIEKLMLRYAQRGAIVARVKGGDPFVFGRGGEEMQTLQRAGIEVEIINGITAGIAAPAALGIPVTHRDCSRGVTFITGHTRDGAPPNWRALAESGTTLVIYMGMTNLVSIVDSLKAAGMANDMPAAVIQNAMNKNQRSVVTTLANLPDAVKREGLGSPSIVVIGEVVNLAKLAQQAIQNDIAA
jgi:uroporphyrin-III C-methyltransferase